MTAAQKLDERRLRDAAATILAYQAETAEGAGVRPLVWERDFDDDDNWWSATGAGLTYEVRAFSKGVLTRWPDNGGFEEFPGTADEAKATAQADFERRVRSALQLVSTPPHLVEDSHAFKNFHRLLCERFDYCHDEKDWRRDQASLIEWIAKRVSAPPPGHDEPKAVAWQWRKKGWRVGDDWSEWQAGRHGPRLKYDPHDYEERALVPASSLASLQQENARLARERDEARALVTEANNSLYGSQGYFHSLNGGPFDKYHLAKGIEDLKSAVRKYSRSDAAAQAEIAALKGRLEEAGKVIDLAIVVCANKWRTKAPGAIRAINPLRLLWSRSSPRASPGRAEQMVERFSDNDIYWACENGRPTPASLDGDYVRFSDYEALTAQLAEARRSARNDALEEAAVTAWVKCVEHCSARDGQKLIGALVGQGVSAAIRSLKETAAHE